LNQTPFFFLLLLSSFFCFLFSVFCLPLPLPLPVLLPAEVSPYNTMAVSGFVLAFNIVELIVLVLMLVFTVYSLVVFISRNQGLKINARSSVFALGALFSALKIVDVSCLLATSLRTYWSTWWLSYGCYFLAFSSLVMAWTTVCENILGSRHRKLFTWCKRLLWVLPVMNFAGSLALFFMNGVFYFDDFLFAEICEFVAFILMIPSMLISSVIMMITASRVLFELRARENFVVTNESQLRGKIALTCLVDSLTNFSYTVLLLLYFFVEPTTLGQWAENILIEVLILTVSGVNFYCVAFHFSELKMSSGNQSHDVEKDPQSKARTSVAETPHLEQLTLHEDF